MFEQAKNIDTAFKNIRFFCVVFMICCTAISVYMIYSVNAREKEKGNKIYVLTNEKLLEAVAIDRSDSLAVEIRDHVKMFHYYFFSLEPDEEVIKRNMTKALYLADGSAKKVFDDLTEAGYYTNLISGNVSQKVEDYDSIAVDIARLPYSFKFFGKLKIVRSTSVVTRSIISEGIIRVGKISDKNPHGFLIERWAILENKDLKIENR
ncbi:MAG: conjugative transposon protein TraK [Bacteroidetes bacterium]|nr:conjugative transposon protein TraK [Bacteroidota bacterium]